MFRGTELTANFLGKWRAFELIVTLWHAPSEERHFM
jgi:hypothetical protein